eukprot:TRINITY_DN7529_c0_g1_i4.p1 TRINITY_DN7529_c0_g1~~TRINITY_DN7529_c0_g1_i4.p1  ORF type:complete len:242 (+),score=100.58 TRINITY_DN7529_c0_g1_i4:182-907(+)
MDRMRSTLGKMQPRPDTETKRQKSSNASVSRNLNDDEDVLSSIELKWQPSELLTLFEKVGLGSLTAPTEERIAKSLKNLERECKKYCDELSSDTDEEQPEDYSIIGKKKKEAPLKQLDPASKFLTKFSKIVGKKEVDGANITKAMIDEFKEEELIDEREIERQILKSREDIKSKYVTKGLKHAKGKIEDKEERREVMSMINLDQSNMANKASRAEFRQVPPHGAVAKTIPNLSSLYVPDKS